jgi:hypothetical protein
MARRTSSDGKSIEDLTAEDLDRHPIWAFVNDDTNELLVQPVTNIPVGDLTGRVVGAHVRLACGRRVRAVLGNVDLSNPRLTQHFLTLSLECDGRWFHLARYHDPDRDRHGPDALARFLGLGLSEVFPIEYDVRPHADGTPGAAFGTISAEPSEKLSRAEIIALAVR